MSKKTVVAVDLDDVVTLFIKPFILFNNRLFGTKLEFKDINDYRLHLMFNTSLAVMIERILFFFKQHHHELELVDGAKKGLLQLKETYDLQIVTSRDRRLETEVIDCLDFHFPSVFSDIHFANNFGEVASAETSKASICKRIGAITLIDDGLHNAVEVSQSGIPVILLNNPWNQCWEIERVIRVAEWDAVNPLIDELAYFHQ